MRYRLEQPPVESAAELAALKATTFRQAFAAANDPVDLAAHLERAFAVETISAELLDPHCDTTWVMDDERPVAYLKVNFGTTQTEPGLSDGLEVEQLYVLASHHGQGLGGLLLDLAAEKARERGLAFVWLGVWEQNTNAISMYRHRGYQEFADHVFMFGEDAQRDVLMRLNLKST
ncbi:MAG: GNAT family N-acetyltransferase [Ornithinibacter sp.]